MTKERKEREFWKEVFIDHFCESKMTVLEIGNIGYKSVASARYAYNNYLQVTGRAGKVKVMTRKEKIFLYKI